MRFTEHELTVALTGVAKSVHAHSKVVRKRKLDPDAAWEELSRYERFQLLDGLGNQVLPALVALPDVEVTPGTRPTYTAEQVRLVVEEQVGDDLGRVRRAVVVKARTLLVQNALTHLPPRLDPDALQHHPEGGSGG
ncbi:hypothetical protein F0U44_18090 [Nocardioides humilatus]|uniref:Uncharacterized protein n=1 Tax=Nocardioides humilatus TaxID=2607660 RepID=A0A5B1L8Q4_9ACTN|nr:hypothetical protein [Nocardioides humilatus]KAA1417083.1 hypothetical protein F0U44_18090 [Nocardioides humilatus]